MNHQKVLVVEDEAIVAADLAESLRNLGFEPVGPADSGEQAIALAGSAQPDVVLMDIMLKGTMLGTEAARIIRQQFGLPVVFLTANSDTSIVNRAMTAEPFGYILKPFEERELRINIEMAIYRRMMEREREALTRRLQDALDHIKVLSGILPLCSYCRKIRDTKTNTWHTLEDYVHTHTAAQISHGMCPVCYEKALREMDALPGS